MPTGHRPPPSEFAQHIAGALRAGLARKNWRQVDLAEQTGISQSQMSKLLRGERQVDVDQLYAICSALELNIADVIAEADETVRTGQAVDRRRRAV